MAPSASQQLKTTSDGTQNGGLSKGKKRERNEQGVNPAKQDRDRLLKVDDSEPGSFNLDDIKSEIAKITEKGGLPNAEAVEKLVHLMQLDRTERKIDLSGRVILADIIAATESPDCLGRFVQSRGLPMLDSWLQEAGKSGDGSSPKEADKPIDELLLALLRAAAKLPMNLTALQNCSIGRSVNHLRTHKNLEIKKKAMCLVEIWKKVVETEMRSNEKKKLGRVNNSNAGTKRCGSSKNSRKSPVPTLSSSKVSTDKPGGTADMVSSSPDLKVNTGPGLPQSTCPSFDLRSALSSHPALLIPCPPSLIHCSQWEKRECIGSGSFGQVYRGFNSEHNQFCAIKEVLVIFNDPRSKEQLKQLNQEIYFLKQFSHPNIVQYYGSIMTDNTLSIYMEYVSKGSIHVLLAKYGPFKESMIRRYTSQILSGLAFLHERRHIHRDIKGANILVGPNNEVKLADFGLAKHISTLTQVHTSSRGTPCWMAPEVILSNHSGKGYNLSADIWSLGCTIVEMATGKPPLHGYEPIQAIFKIANDNTYIPEIPDVLSDEGKNFLQLCLQRDPASRPSAAQLMDHQFIRNQEIQWARLDD